jgi:hypothetical protein
MIKFLIWFSIVTITIDVLYVLIMLRYSKNKGEW